MFVRVRFHFFQSSNTLLPTCKICPREIQSQRMCLRSLTVYLPHENTVCHGQFGEDILNPKLGCLLNNLCAHRKIRCATLSSSKKPFWSTSRQKRVNYDIASYFLIVDIYCFHKLFWMFPMRFQKFSMHYQRISVDTGRNLHKYTPCSNCLPKVVKKRFYVTRKYQCDH